MINKDQLAEFYKSGASLRDCAEKFGCSRQYAYKVVLASPVPLRNRNPRHPRPLKRDALAPQIVESYKAGLSVREIGSGLNASPKLVRGVLKANELLPYHGLLDLNGQSFGLWRIKEYAGDGHWLAQCQCGEVREVDGKNLRHGRSKSCGGKECKAIAKAALTSEE